jgi:DNA helicase IV
MSDAEGRGADDRHPDHEAEQAHLRRARRALEAMVERSARAVEFADQRVRDEDSADAHIARGLMADRRAAVDVGAVALCFGRIDEDPAIADGDRWYVGRRHVEDAEGEPLIVDWRAPVAVPFYRATAADPCGLERRRRFSCDVDELLAIFDERLDDPTSASAAGIPDPVLAEIERGRSGEMSDIVATIAAEQDEIIRAPLEDCVIVQGGPGTGKTAVGLHRAAFLLFAHREELSRHQVLVIGPNRVFLRYVANVLPSLGETAVSQATITSLLRARVRERGEDTPAATELKGRAVMAEVLARLARSRCKVPDDELVVPLGLRRLRFSPETVAEAIRTARDNGLPLNDAKGVFTEILLRDARAQLLARDVAQEDLARVLPDLRRDREFRRMVDRIWPNLSGAQLVRSLLGNRAARRRAVEGLLDPDEADALHRASAKRIADEPWSAADLALLDEANALVSGGGRRYGHVVVDEAQDLSAMELRAAGRRAFGRSMTILGDIAQATALGAQRDWHAVVDALGVGSSVAVRRRELTVGYRVPGPILDEANRLLPVTAPGITAARSIRGRGPGPEHHVVTAADVHRTVADVVSDLGEEWSTVGVIALDHRVDDLLDSLTTRGLDVGDTRRTVGLDHAVSVVEPPTAKGLEFDVTVVVEPAEFADLAHGLRLLYVALTRSVQRLAIVRSRAMPAPLDDRP